MRNPKPLFSAFLVLIVATTSVCAQETVVQFSKGLSVPLLGKYGREALVQDEFLYQFSMNTFEIPQEGDLFGPESVDDRPEWISIEADDDGWFKGRNLRGGYLLVEYSSRNNEDLILEANGHNEVYVNGAVRGGDTYGYGWVEHPVKIKKGNNIIIFRGGRGRVQARLVRAEEPVFFSSKDPLLPDLIEGDDKDRLGAIRIINNSSKAIEGYKIKTIISNNIIRFCDVPEVKPYGSRKVPYLVAWDPSLSSKKERVSFILLDAKGKEICTKENDALSVSIKSQGSKHKETFVSEIDGSVQYYSVVPPVGGSKDSLALFLSLHGASVEAVNQANAYGHKTWGTLVAATNRRPYGFDWEDWGRLDAQEVLNLAIERYKPNPRRLYLTGHSMGGHGTWQVGATLPGHWAAIGPSAGWYSFWSYAGKENEDNPDPVNELINRSTNPSNTLELSRNYLHYGLYILHGDKDDNVPVEQARFMRSHLGQFHPDFAYYERPDAGHWWGNECVDWPLMFDYFESHEQLEVASIKKLEFVTASPGVSSSSRHLHILQQIEALKFSSLKYELDEKNKSIEIATQNVKVLMIDFTDFPENQPYEIIIDSSKSKYTGGSSKKQYYYLNGLNWSSGNTLALDQKGEHRNGLFKDAFRHNMVFVYGTKGTKEENRWAYEKSRFDSETFWYRGNGAIDIIADVDYSKENYSDRNVILYGHSDMNSAWNKVLKDCPIQIARGEARIGEQEFTGTDLATYFIYPLSGSDKNSVGVIAGTGLEGLKATIPNRYFVSGSGFPDFFLFKTSMYREGTKGIIGAGYFDNNWQLEEADFKIR